MTCNSRRACHQATKNGIDSYLYHFTHLPLVVKLAESGYGIIHSRSGVSSKAGVVYVCVHVCVCLYQTFVNCSPCSFLPLRLQ